LPESMKMGSFLNAMTATPDSFSSEGRGRGRRLPQKAANAVASRDALETSVVAGFGVARAVIPDQEAAAPRRGVRQQPPHDRGPEWLIQVDDERAVGQPVLGRVAAVEGSVTRAAVLSKDFQVAAHHPVQRLAALNPDGLAKAEQGGLQDLPAFAATEVHECPV